MAKLTKKVTDVDSKGNPIMKKSGGKNNKKSGFKKTEKNIAAVMAKKPVRKIVEYYYFFNEEMDARKLQSAMTRVIWKRCVKCIII